MVGPMRPDYAGLIDAEKHNEREAMRKCHEEQLKEKDARIADLLKVIKILSKELRNA